MPDRKKTLHFRYRFELANGRLEEVSLLVASPSLTLVPDGNTDSPDWTRLGYRQCTNCPLDPEAVERCPVAVPLADIGSRLGTLVSYHQVTVEVETPERTVRATTDTQQAVRSLLGLVMAVSGCPRMDFFRPLARFHLPLATVEETLARTAAFYLLEQYFTRSEDDPWDRNFSGLATIYREVQTVNKDLSFRLREAGVFTELNWIAHLDALAQILPMAIDERIRDLAYLFPDCRP